MENPKSYTEDGILSDSKMLTMSDKIRFASSATTTFELYEPQSKKKLSACCVWTALAIYLMMLTIGLGLLALKVFNMQEEIRKIQREDSYLPEELVSPFYNETFPESNFYRKNTRGEETLIESLEEEINTIRVSNYNLLMRMNNITLAAGQLGNKGEPGPPGGKGEKGDMGLQGPAGSKGEPGSKGIGFPGEKGEKGNPGEKGTGGAQKGEKGSSGKDGTPGIPGGVGAPGAKGEAGIEGPKGTKGDEGVQGLRGPSGEDGSKGDSGLAGPKGEPGMKGDRGPTGLQGNKGEVGEKGEMGPRGPIGAPGNKGDAGGVGLPGQKGEAGLNGEVGAPGLPGLNGMPGQRGEKGVRGLPGEKGSRWSSGSPGPKGEPGMKGAKGDMGPRGPPGSKGDRAEPGQHYSHPSIRLNGTAREGRVEIRYQEKWGTICDDGWDERDGTVVCKMLGYSHAVRIMTAPPGSGQIWLDDVECSGTESSILNCEKSKWGEHNCSHSEDAGVECA
ncbi:macrophage receptor MARCO isoform X5 [Dermochelys coriacea]|uniref:macrophage receptor MARCO isoform X5 n=1 Tax=Dermochelys coriacea TaxID=27794 RepID=UPI0018E751D8|nr:macrophage receptor MARCO isoform X5 [Dermochelys coriacea]